MSSWQMTHNQFRTALRSPVQPRTAQYSPSQSNTAQDGPVQPSTAHYSPLQLSTAQYSPVHPSTLQDGEAQLQPSTFRYSLPSSLTSSHLLPYLPFQKPHSLLCLVLCYQSPRLLARPIACLDSCLGPSRTFASRT